MVGDSLSGCGKTSSPLSVISVSLPRLRKLPEWISGIGVPSRESLFRHIRRVQRKPLPAFVVFQAPTVQSNHHIGAAYVGVTGVEFLVSCSGVTDSAPFSTMRWNRQTSGQSFAP